MSEAAKAYSMRFFVRSGAARADGSEVEVSLLALANAATDRLIGNPKEDPSLEEIFDFFAARHAIVLGLESALREATTFVRCPACKAAAERSDRAMPDRRPIWRCRKCEQQFTVNEEIA